MNNSWIREIPNSRSTAYIYNENLNKDVEVVTNEFLLRIDTSDAISLANISLNSTSSQSNATTIFLTDTNTMKFNFNRLIKNIVYVEVEEFIVPSLDYLIPTKYLIPDIKDTVTDTRYNENVAGNIPWELTPINYFSTYTGNALAQYGYISNICIDTSNTSPGTIATLASEGQIMTGVTSGATGRIQSLYINTNLQKVFYITLNTHNFIQGEVINVTTSSGSAITSWIPMSDTLLSRDDETRQMTVAYDNNGLVPSYEVWPPIKSNGSVNIHNYNTYKTTSLQNSAADINRVDINTIGSTNSMNWITGKTEASNFIKNGDTICITGCPNSVFSGCFTANTSAITLGTSDSGYTYTDEDRSQYFAVETKPLTVLNSKDYWDNIGPEDSEVWGEFISDRYVTGLNKFTDRIQRDFKNHRIAVRISEFGDFYSSRINVKQGNSFLPSSASIQQMLTTTNYEVETSSFYGFRKTFSTPLTLNSLTLNFFTNDGQQLILNDILFGPIGNKKNKISITMKIRVLEEETPNLQTEISTVPYANFQTV